MSDPTPCQICRFPNSSTNVFCAQCGAQIQTNAAGAAAGLPSWAKLFLIIAGTIMVAFFGIMAIAIISPQSLAPPTPSLGAKTLGGDTAETKRQHAHVQQSPLPAITNAERLAKARLSLNSSSRYELDVAEGHLNNILQGTPEYKEAQSLLRKVAAKRAPLLREQLGADYGSVVSKANPHLNYIDTKYTRIKGGYALWATHEYFSQYTLSIGNDAHVITAWIDSHRGELKEAGVVRVGVMGRNSFASWSYFDLK